MARKLEPSRQPTPRSTVVQMAKDAHKSGNSQQANVLARVASGYKSSDKGKKR